MMTRPTGITDSKGSDIQEGDLVTLDGLMTADDSLGSLPNGWLWGEDAVCKVIWDERMTPPGWGLDMGIEPDTAYNSKYMSHAVSLLRDGEVEIVNG